MRILGERLAQRREKLRRVESEVHGALASLNPRNKDRPLHEQVNWVIARKRKWTREYPSSSSKRDIKIVLKRLKKKGKTELPEVNQSKKLLYRLRSSKPEGEK